MSDHSTSRQPATSPCGPDVASVARRHLGAVEAGDPEAMAADYAADAVIERAGETHRGQAAIAAYFATVPARLGQGRVVFDDLSIDGSTATFRWHLAGTPVAASGTDVCTIIDGLIVHQVVHLDSTDF